MKIRLFSDLHNEIGSDYDIPHLDSDSETTLVLAGDIHTKFRIKGYAESMSERFKYVVYVLGNHDYWGDNLDNYHKAYSHFDNVHFLHNETVDLDGISFAGCTLWTDFRNQNPLSMYHFQSVMVDARKIRVGSTYSKCSSEIILYEHLESRKFLEEFLSSDKKLKVVVSHHSPSFLNENPYFSGNVSSDFYHTSLESLVEKSDLWMFGHTHFNVDRVWENSRMVTNQIGYRGYEKVDDFDPLKVIEVN